MKATWQPNKKQGEVIKRSDLPDSVFAFPKQRKEPLTDANHVRDAIARFDQTIDVSDEDRELAFANIRKAANYYDIDMTETDWTQLAEFPIPAGRQRTVRNLRVRLRLHARNVSTWSGKRQHGSSCPNDVVYMERRTLLGAVFRR